jgi:hypothetical protein
VAIDTQTPQSRGWWLNRLLKRLSEKQATYDLLDSYYDGRNVIPVHADRAVGQAYQRLMAVSRSNFAELVVEATRERIQPSGFRTGAAGDDLGDSEAWRIWQGNSLDADSSLVHSASLALGLSYVIVGPVDDDLGVPLITPEDPREVVVETDPRQRRKVLAGLKVFRDDVEAVDRAYLYLPGEVHRAVRAAAGEGFGMPLTLEVGGWEWEGTDTYQGPPPVVPFPNRPKMGQLVTRGEFETHLPILDRINYTILQRVEIATLQAFRQRAIIGDLPDNDEDGNAIDYDDIFEAAPGALWKVPATAEMWESGQVDLGPLRLSIRDDIQDLAAVTRTPLFYLTPEATNGSAEGASLAREGLIFKVRDRLVEIGEAWEQVMSLAFRFAGDAERANRSAMEIIWTSPERQSLAMKADAGAKALAGGLPLRKVRQEVWNFTPTEIEEMEAQDVADALRAQGAELVGQVVRDGTDATGVEPAR